MNVSSEHRNKWITRIARPARLLTSSVRTLPCFLIVGAQKAGTSSLYEYINNHPRVKKASRKEVHFFDWQFSKGERWYRSHFPMNSSVSEDKSGEASPLYLYHPDCARRIHSIVPNVKIIILLRCPVQRAIAHYRHEVRHGNEPLPIDRALRRYESSSERFHQLQNAPEFFTREDQLYSYVSRGFYLAQIERYRRYFPDDSILLLNSDDMFDNPKNTTELVCDFLGLERQLLPEIGWDPMNVNPQKMNVTLETLSYLTSIYGDHNDDLFEVIGKSFKWASA